MNVQMKALTVEEIKERADEHNYIQGIVRVDLTDVVYDDQESFLDRLSNALIGDTTLTSISQEVVGVRDGYILFKVSGDASAVLQEELMHQ